MSKQLDGKYLVFEGGSLKNMLGQNRGESFIEEKNVEKEYQENNLVFQFLKRIETIIAKMREKGFESDARIFGKVMSRFVKYVDLLKREKAIFKEDNNEVAKFIDIEDAVERSIPITYEGPKKDGAVYNEDGRRMDTGLKRQEIWTIRNLSKQGKDGYEIIDFCFSKQAKTEILTTMKVALEDIEGVTVRVERDAKSSEEIISLQFDERFLEKLFSSL